MDKDYYIYYKDEQENPFKYDDVRLMFWNVESQHDSIRVREKDFLKRIVSIFEKDYADLKFFAGVYSQTTKEIVSLFIYNMKEGGAYRNEIIEILQHYGD